MQVYENPNIRPLIEQPNLQYPYTNDQTIIYKGENVTPKDLITLTFMQLAFQEEIDYDEVVKGKKRDRYESYFDRYNCDNKDDYEDCSEQFRQEYIYKYDMVKQQQEVIEDIEQSTPPNLEEDMQIQCQETPTQCLLYIPSSLVDDPTIECTQETANYKKFLQTANYERFLEEKLNNVISSDQYKNRHAQTFNYITKHKYQIAKIYVKAEGTQAVSYEVYDATKNLKSEFDQLRQDIKAKAEEELQELKHTPYVELPIDLEAIKFHAEKQFDKEKYEKSMKQDELDEMDDEETFYVDFEDILKTQNDLEEELLREREDKLNLENSDPQKVIYNSRQISNNLMYMERIVNQNQYQEQHIKYRNYQKKGDEFKQDFLQDQQDPIIQLFQYKCALTEQCKVTGADFNFVNKDLLAASYTNNETSDGHIMFWTLKNPTYQRIITYPSKINCCKFSDSQPNLVAAGTVDGIVAVWDIRRKSNNPIAENIGLVDRHCDSVQEIQWTENSVISISSDSRIVEMTLKNRLRSKTIMNLKTLDENPTSTAGYSLDFLKNEKNIYLAAMEDGTVHRCLKPYAEQYLSSYLGHSGPVYKVRCNPFFRDIFLTCSADWTCKLWNWTEEQPKATFQSQNLQDEVLDFEWSPHASMLFASVCKDGRLELWDLSKNNMLDPIFTIMPEDQQVWPAKSMIRFSQNSPILVTGDISGDINVYRLFGYENIDPLQEEDKLKKLLYPKGYKQFNVYE